MYNLQWAIISNNIINSLTRQEWEPLVLQFSRCVRIRFIEFIRRSLYAQPLTPKATTKF